jgi:peptidoglycan hydrolase-like protein with peptidoglycan-binding domain
VNVQTNTQTNLSYVPKNQFTKYLSRGSTGTEVVSLQTFLRQYRDLYPEGLVTGMYGPATERAVKRFQEKYKIAYVGSLGYGNVGVKTRAKLNEF